MAPKQLKIVDMFVRTGENKVSNSLLKRSLLNAEIDENVTPAKKVLAQSLLFDRSIQNNTLKDNLKNDFIPKTPFFAKSSKFSELMEKLSPLGKLIVKTLADVGWQEMLCAEFSKPYMNDLFKFLDKEDKLDKKIFPPRHLIFNAFNLTPFNNIRIVLIGQDPYHNDGQAHGLCFSVPKGIPPPPSLKNIYSELKEEFPDFKKPNHGCLISWAKQGIFMLNATLTVEAHKANSHSSAGWQQFTDAVIKNISLHSKQGVVFLLWGGFAHKKELLIDVKRHQVIKTAHPSPLSYHRFKGSRCFTRVNEALIKLGHKPIKWSSLDIEEI